MSTTVRTSQHIRVRFSDELVRHLMDGAVYPDLNGRLLHVWWQFTVPEAGSDEWGATVHYREAGFWQRLRWLVKGR